MVKRSLRRAAALLLGLWLLPALPAQAGIIPDPTGDTFNTGTIDLTGTEVRGATPTTTITLTFASAVAAPSAFAPNSLTGFIDLDTNSGPGATAPWGGPVAGGNNWINFFVAPNPGTPSIPGPLVNLGDEFYIDLGSELFHPGLVDVVSTATNLTVGVAPVIYAGTTVQIFLPSALIGNPAGLSYGVLVGDFNGITDRAPNGSTGLLATPEPSGLALAGVAGLGALLYRRRRARA
jgi:hypothetical protein